MDGGVAIRALGGLGLFLMGMTVMCEALRALAGSRLRAWLLRFTRTPWSGALIGAATTAALQSSSATTVATVGFVQAGLISFPSSLGIIFGANVGSTGLGWLVALLGLKLDLAGLMPPLIAIGACLRLLGRGRLAQIGFALAGFGVLFLGISTLQEAMAGHGVLLQTERFDGASVAGRFQLVVLGLLTTVITQSSGAGVATALTALTAGAIDLGQAGALVIGMDVGTTITAQIAALGANLSARRTATAHLVFNLFTAVMAFLLLPAYLGLGQRWLAGPIAADPEFALTAFHTGFNLLGVALLLPFTQSFARLIQALLPSPDGRAADDLDEPPSADTGRALDLAQAAQQGVLLELMRHLRQALGASASNGQHRGRGLEDLEADLARIEQFLDQIHLRRMEEPDAQRLLHLLHSLDHLQRLHERCEEEPERASTVRQSGTLQQERHDLLAALEQLEPLVEMPQWSEVARLSQATGRSLHRRVKPLRQGVMADVASGDVVVELGSQRLEAIRWLRRVSQHLGRISGHLEAAALTKTSGAPPCPTMSPR
ncbi:Na/Pi cotransporter family protein [Synechococcus sp. J7-Johnson]|uniref:Na/Pi cotransporter family protein n=1 Tax=Synechococcus sp. J7-Johnson TaxID=2823737 RepID=UPI0020CBFF82|nr:Na/Pi symporter [Synechococcus sp. J7-Johnson]MCP9840454.1 Na/Pi cotransporter family protein [Synechococcus sp. J7-Johnson]